MKKFYSLLAFIVFVIPVNAQVCKEISINDYLERVRKNNLEYAAQRLSLDYAEADLLSASVFNNPSISLGYYTCELNNMQMGRGGLVELSQTISPGRRSVAVKLAHNQKEIANAMLVDFFRVLREEATLKWIETVKHREIIEVKKKSYKEQIEMIQSDSIRRAHEIINDLDALQNRVETSNFYNSVAESEAEMYTYFLELTRLCGMSGEDTVIVPERRNIWNTHKYDLNKLVEEALVNRWDLVAASKEFDRSKLAVVAAKRDRIPEFDLFIGYGLNSEVKNEIAPAPRHGSIEFGISFPIPLFNRGKGEILSAKTAQREAEYRYRQAELQVKNEVVSNFYAFQSAEKRVKLFTSGVVKNAKEVLDKKREDYYKGNIHLIEVMDAQRSYDEIIYSLYSALYDKSLALVKLQSAAGIWDIEYKLPAAAGTAAAESATAESAEATAAATAESAAETAGTASSTGKQ